MWELFLPLLFGGTLTVPREEVRIDTPRFLAWMEEQSIESGYLPPFMVQPLLDFLKAGHRLPLRRLLVGVEPIPEETLVAINRILPDLQIINGYGPTEATICCTLYEVQPELTFHRNAPIGKPYQNVQIYLLDEHGQPVPVGVPGEVYIGGDGVARGYLARPELTAERFVPDPFATHLRKASSSFSSHPAGDGRLPEVRGGSRLYRTGDLARWLPDGNLMFLGRVDFQVKVRGFRIELGEIERVMEEHEAIDEAVAVVREDAPGVKRIVGYFTWVGETPPDSRELRAFLGQTLPDYMIPGVFVPLDAFPRTPNDKIDRKALPKPVYHRPEEGIDYRSPATDAEVILARIWAELLGLEKVGVDDDFFELGGDSILSIQMISRAADEGLIITARQIFQYPTIAGLAAVAEPGEAVKAEQGEVTGAAPLTPIQRWFFEQEFPHPDYWNQAILLDVGRPLDADLLAEALAALLRHHDALRLRFRQDETGVWTQGNAPVDDRTIFEIIDLAQTPDDALAGVITDHSTRIQGSLNLMNGPLFRAAYFDLGSDRGWRLLLAAHHLVIDGVSWRILTEDLQRAYLQLANGRPAQLPRKTTAFIHWAQALAEYARTTDFSDALSFWRAMIARPVAPLPLDQPASPEAALERHVKTLQIRLDATHLTASNADLQTLLLAAFARALADWTHAARVGFFMEAHGRDLELPGMDITRTTGWFTTLYPVILDINDAENPELLLEDVGAQARAAADQAASYGILRYLLLESGLEVPLQVSFNYLGRFDAPDRGGFAPAAEDKGPERHPDNPRPFLIDFAASLVGEDLAITWAYSAVHFHPETISVLADAFTAYLRALVAEADEAKASFEEDFLDDLLDELDL